MELKAFRSDLQNNHLLPINEANGVIYIFSFLLIILAVLAKGLFPEVTAPYQRVWRKAFLFAGLFMVVNAFMTAEFSTILGRYQARVFWVLPVLCYLYLLQLWIVKKGKKGATDN